MDMACDMNSVGGGAYSIATAGTKSNPYVAVASGAFSIYCVVR